MEEKETMNIPVPEKPIEPAPKQPAPIMSSPATTMMQPEKKKANVGTLACIVILVLLALGGLGFGIYGMTRPNTSECTPTDDCVVNNTDASQTSQADSTITELKTKISDLETSVKNKDATISELEATIAALKSESKDGTATLMLGEKIAESETGKTFKIDNCTADGGTAAGGSHFSLKCHVATTDGEAMISYHDSDGSWLRFTVYK